LIVLGFVAIAALVAADAVTYSELRSFLVTRVDQSLAQSAEAIAMPLAQAGAPGFNGSQGGPPPTNGYGQPGTFAVRAPNTAVEVRTAAGLTRYPLNEYRGDSHKTVMPRLPAQITGVSVSAVGHLSGLYFDAPATTAGGPEFRVFVVSVQQGEQLIVAAPLSDTNGTLHHLLLVELSVTGAAIVLAILAGWWLVRLGLRPLRAMERTAGAIAAGELGERVPGENTTTEVGRLATALNVMLGHIESAFAVRDTTEAALRQSESTLRRFVADASHELRTPVAAVSAYAELFERGASSRPEDLARVMKGIRGETARMGHLVDDLLFLARMDEQVPLEQAPVDLVAVAGESVEASRTLGPEWVVTIEADRPVEVTGDQSRLRQVWDNLLANLRSHTPPGTTATVRISSEDGWAVCTITDDGPGITDEQATRLFERFYRVDQSRSRASGGAGLGLSIVAVIVAAHGGSATAAPRPDASGAVFGFRIPTRQP
jgi:two-component system OmpR family sensor kinase